MHVLVGLPHVEGGRNPLKRFAAATERCTAEELDGFYEHNMADLMGPAPAAGHAERGLITDLAHAA